MNKNITFKQYRAIDLTIWAIFLVLSEGLTTVATTKWFVGVPFAISTTLLFLCIGMMRWGAWSAVLAVVGGLTFVIASGADAKRCIIYLIGNMFSFLALIFIRLIGKGKIRSSNLLLMLYALITYLCVCIGRWLVSLIFMPALDSIIAYIGTDIITLLFTAVILASLKSVDGMLEDQHDYVLRQAREREAEQTADTKAIEEITSDPDYLDDISWDDESLETE